MCTPDLQVKIKKTAQLFAEDDKEKEEEEKPRDRLKVMNYITGQTAVNDGRYVMQTPP